MKFSQAVKAVVYFKDSKLDLLTGKKTAYSASKIINKLDNYDLKQTYRKPVVFHLFYEFGHLLQGNLEKIKEDDILMIEIHYGFAKDFRHSFDKAYSKGLQLRPSQKKISFNEYKKVFKKCYEYLLDGDCYQLNLTFPSLFSFNEGVGPEDFLEYLWKNVRNIGEYAHGTWLGPLDSFYLSNTPECLFQIKKKEKNFNLYSMPIKGSLKNEGTEFLNESWKKLKNSKKDEGELFMIADMLRNDLSSIEKPVAKIVKKKSLLEVPGIIHQYSLLSVDLDYKVHLGQIIRSLFPGGSITGAPKKRVMDLLYSLESEQSRGFYCGSTIILHESLLASSINIRSAEVFFGKRLLKYSSGSGLTLLSNALEEYEELKLKEQSFMNLLQT
ncbi:chorismate-binding protein [Bacteriovoracales bacterium]|nr:chorismate-binding protein [Bacteriovoracales bacterium]